MTTTEGYWLIQSGKQFVRSIDGVSGRVCWTTDRTEAKGFYRQQFAAELADGIGRVVLK